MAEVLTRIASRLDELGLHKLADDVDHVLDEAIERDETELYDKDSLEQEALQRQRAEHDRVKSEDDLVWDIVGALKADPDIKFNEVIDQLHTDFPSVSIKLNNDIKIWVGGIKQYDYTHDFDHDNFNFEVHIEKDTITKTLNFAVPKKEMMGYNYSDNVLKVVSEITNLIDELK